MITQEKIDEYLINPYNCPYCNSNDLESPISETHIDGPEAIAKVYCNSCGKKWKEVYSLTGIIEIE